jgi:peptidyl-prolyl cis-trans isomerase B (cyclophilin B)
MNKVYISLLITFLSLSSFCFSETEEKEIMTNENKSNPVVLINTTAGDIKVELFADKAPITVKNFVDYVKSGQFDHTIFHRVIDGFMIQGGGFTKEFKQKSVLAPIKNEADNGLSNQRGTISMARTSDPNSATAQFFINVADNKMLDFRGKNPRDYGYCVFGKVIEGMNVVDKIKSVKTGSKEGHQDVPLENVEIIKVSLQE